MVNKIKGIITEKTLQDGWVKNASEEGLGALIAGGFME